MVEKDKSVEEAEFDILRFIQILLIHKWKFLTIFIIVFIIAALYGIKQPKFYSVDYEVFYNESIKEFVVESDVPVIKNKFEKAFWFSTMKSDEMSRLIAQNSNLPYSASTVKRMIKVDMVEVKGGSVPIFKVTVTSRNNTDLPKLINGFVFSLNHLLVKIQADNSERLIHFLSNQIEDSNRKLADLDREILSGGTNKSTEIRDYNKMLTELENFRASLLNAQIDLSSVVASRTRTEKELVNLDGTIVNESAFSEPLKVQLMNLQVDLARALTKNREEHPTVRSIRDNIQLMESMLRDSIQQQLQIKSLIQNPLKGQLMSKLMELKLEEISLEARVSSLREVISDYEVKILPDTTSYYQENFRNRELLYITINQLNSRLIEAQSAAHGSLSRFILSDEPTVPVTPSNRPLYFFILLGIVAGVAVSAGLILLYDMLDNRLMVLSDYERFFNYPLLGGFMQNNNLKQQVEELLDPDSTPDMLVECSEISVNVKHLIKNNNKVFALCSPVRNEGKSLISLLVAVSLAKRGMSVLLADFDFYDPKLTKKLGCDLNQGLTDYISGDLPLEYIYNETTLPNLSFAPAGRTSTPSKFSYDSECFSNFISLSRQMFDVVIIDTPAVLYIPDVATFMDSVDSILVIARMRMTTRNSLIRMASIFGENRDKISGTILNGIQKGISSKYSCYYNYKYEYQYSHKPKKFI